MKTIYFCIIFTLPILSFAQSPCNDTNVILSSQAEVDSFPSRFCNSVCGLSIQGNDITNLDSLYVLEKVGMLQITYNPLLADIGGLHNITSLEALCMGGGLTVEGNNMLSNLDGLSGITQIDGTLSIVSNTMLSDISGLSNLSDVNGIVVRSNASLEDLTGLDGIAGIGGSLVVSCNPGLADLNGLSRVANIAGGVLIENSDALASLDGLAAVTRIEGQVIVQWNEDLTNIRGLSNLDHIGQLTGSGASLSISYNETLTSLDGLQGLDTIPGTLTIEGNTALSDLDGLSSLRTLDNYFGDSYNSGIRIANNSSLTDISGIAAVETIGRGRACYLEIISNHALTTIDSLGLTSINGTLGSTLRISDNGSLVNIDGLKSLQRISGGISAAVEIAHNPSLQNIDGLSGLSNVTSGRSATVTIAYNPVLGRFCGLYTLFNSRGIGCGSPECYNTSGVWFDGNERNPTPERIEEEGPCDAVVTQPTNIAFSQVTSEGMRVRFNNATGFESGYIVLMRSYEPSAPQYVPQDGQAYNVGQLLGSSSIVVHVGKDTTFVVSGLLPSIPYYFDVFSFKLTEDGNDYLIVNPLQGNQTTIQQAALVSSLMFNDVTDESITVQLNGSGSGDYICLMKAFGYPSPNDVPVDGKEYRVGNTIGSSTIVVNIGDGSGFTVNGLIPDLNYYFDIYSYDARTLTYQARAGRGSQRTNAKNTEELLAYPNPFDVATTIPFVISNAEQSVHVAIYDAMGREVNVLTTGSYDVGRHEASWDGFDKNGRRANAGVYIYSIKTDAKVITGRVSLR